MPRPYGLIPTKPAVLGAANETKTTLMRNMSEYYILSKSLNEKAKSNASLNYKDNDLVGATYSPGTHNSESVAPTIK